MFGSLDVSGETRGIAYQPRGQLAFLGWGMRNKYSSTRVGKIRAQIWTNFSHMLQTCANMFVPFRRLAPGDIPDQRSHSGLVVVTLAATN